MWKKKKLFNHIICNVQKIYNFQLRIETILYNSRKLNNSACICLNGAQWMKFNLCEYLQLFSLIQQTKLHHNRVIFFPSNCVDVWGEIWPAVTECMSFNFSRLSYSISPKVRKICKVVSWAFWTTKKSDVRYAFYVSVYH